MTADMTSIKVPKALRDELNELANQGGRGTTLADVLTQLLEEHKTTRLRQRLAFEELLARAKADPDAVAKAGRIAHGAIEHLRRPQAS
ncbi:hypothetical protein AB0C14_32470 [Microbispora hainanensis]|uniref:hypothetical protein n=1 Tax=Microbispora hainanensis TaxID=568844 RepID=UPI0033C952E7